MKIGIIGAMDEEIDLLLNHLKNVKKTLIANTLFIEGELYGKEIILLKSGIGKVNAAMATTIMHEKFSPAYVINTGSAGGISTELQIGDIIISKEVVYHDVDATSFHYEYGQVPQMPSRYKGNQKLMKLAEKASENLSVQSMLGLIATGDSFMDDEVKVANIQKNFPEVLATEMEAGAIAQVCYQYQTPFLIIRALSDIAGQESSISFEEFLQQAANNAVYLILEVLKNFKTE